MTVPGSGTMSNFTMPWRRNQQPLSSGWRNLAIALLCLCLAGMAILIFVPDATGLFLLALYSIPSNSMIPVPHEPGVLYFAKYYHPLWIACAGVLGTAVAAFADYELIGRAMNHPKLDGTRNTRVYQWAVRWLMARPFVTIIIFAATPLPIYVVRVLAPASGYSIKRYIAALMVGRFPRFLVLAWFGYAFPMPTWLLVVLFVVMVAALLIPLARQKNQNDAPQGETASPPPCPELPQP